MPTNCLSVFDHFVGFARKGLREFSHEFLTEFSDHSLVMRFIGLQNTQTHKTGEM